MITVMISSANKREQQVLDTALKQRNLKVVPFEPAFSSYIKMMQFNPDVIIMEMLKAEHSDLRFIDLIRRQKRLSKVPVIAFGGDVDPLIRNGMLKRGVTDYLTRPLKFGTLMQLIEEGLKRRGKTLQEAGETAAAPEFNSAMLFDPQVLPTKKIEAMANHVGRLLAFPFTVARILKITNNVDKGAVELANVIQADPVIAAQMMKVSNSVFFASLNRRISTVKDAIVRVGFLETKKIVMGIAVMDLFKPNERNAGFNRIEYWHHSLACAIIAERLAKKMGDINRDEAFLAGLLHDLGILILDEYFPDVFQKVLDKTAGDAVDFIAQERAMLHVTHLDLMAELFSRWKLHEDMTNAIIARAKPAELMKGNASKPAEKMAICLWIAEVLAKTLSIGSECDQFIVPPPAHVCQAVKLAAGIGQNFIDEVCRELKVFRQFFSLPAVEFPQKFETIENVKDVHVGVINETGDLFIPPALYLLKEGAVVDMLTPDAVPAGADGKYHLLIAWCDVTTSKEKIEHYRHIVKRRKEGEADTAGAAMVPLLACVDAGSSLPVDAAGLGVSFVPKEIDIRNLDSAVVETLNGRTVAYKEYAVSAGAERMSAEAQESLPPSDVPVAS